MSKVKGKFSNYILSYVICFQVFLAVVRLHVITIFTEWLTGILIPMFSLLGDSNDLFVAIGEELHYSE